MPTTQLQRDPELSEEEKAKEEEVRAWVKSIQLDEGDDYAKWEQRFLDSPGCIARCLRAENWKVEGAKKRLQATLEWRRDYKPDLIPPDEIKEETEGGKIVVTGFTHGGLPVIYLRPAKENTEPSTTQVRHMIFQLERAIDLMPEGVSKLAMVISFAGASARSSPPMKITKSVIEILQKYYFERLGKALVINLPWYLKSFFATVSPFLDEQTRQKLQMNPKLTDVIPLEQLDAEYGGTYAFEYKHDVYLPAICKFCGIADDGTRTKERPGPVRTGTAATTATNMTTPAVTPALGTVDEEERGLAVEDSRADSASSRTAVSAGRAPSRLDDGGKGKTIAATEGKSESPLRHFFAMCRPGQHARDNFDDNAAAADTSRRSSMSSSASSSSRSWRSGWMKKKKSRRPAVERAQRDGNAETITDPTETAHLEKTFKDAEPQRAVAKDDPEILHALQHHFSKEAEEPAMPLGTPGIASPGLGKTSVADAAQEALRLMKKATSSQEDDGEATKHVIRAPTHDRAVDVVRPEALRSETVASSELVFSVSSRDQ